MNQTAKKQIMTWYVVILLLVTLFLNVFSNLNLGMPFSSSMVHYFSEEIAWESTALMLIFLYMHHEYFRRMERREYTAKSLAVNALFFGIMSLLSCYSGSSTDPNIFKFGFMALILAGLFGGLRVSLPATLFSVLVFSSTFTWSFPLTAAIILMAVGGIVGGVVGESKYARNLEFVPFVAVFAADIALLPGIVDVEGVSIGGDLYSMYYASCLAIPIDGLYAMALVGMFRRIIQNRKLIAKSKEDLRLAHDIQLAALPRELPTSSSISIHGDMIPAVEVGGDFYDCFSIGRNLIAFVVADVSDKGLPASLLMMRMMGSVKTSALMIPEPGAVLTAVNKELCRNNPADQFLTMWAAIYDPDTGILQYANAGHTPPYLSRKGGDFRRLPMIKGTVIGFSDSMRYKSSTTVLEDGDILFAYTDGVNEAFNVHGEEFGHARMEQVLNAPGDRSPKGLIDSMETSLRAFIGRASASDDVTMLAFSVDRSEYRTVTVPGKVEELDAVNGFIKDVMAGHGCSAKSVLKMNVVAEEIFVNICDHAYKGSEGDVAVYCRVQDGEVKLTFADDAQFFNPVNKDDVYIDEDVVNWPVGGFGIHMVKNLVDHMDYKFFAGKNILTVWKKVEVEA